MPWRIRDSELEETLLMHRCYTVLVSYFPPSFNYLLSYNLLLFFLYSIYNVLRISFFFFFTFFFLLACLYLHLLECTVSRGWGSNWSCSPLSSVSRTVLDTSQDIRKTVERVDMGFLCRRALVCL